jgi:hypothetical protein
VSVEIENNTGLTGVNENQIMRRTLLVCICALLLSSTLAMAAENSGGENASNPLAKVKNTDLRWQHLDMDSGNVNDFFIDGAFMANDKLKIKYELHYWETDVTGQSEQGWESITLKGIYFPAEGTWGNLKYRLALGLDWLLDIGDQEKGIGSGADQLAPFGGVALGLQGGTMLIPLVQQFWSYNGKDVNTTALRLIGMQPLPQQMWLKLDAKVPVEWENDRAVPITAELQLGKNINKHIALYVDGLAGIGGDSPYDWGVGTGLRFKY